MFVAIYTDFDKAFDKCETGVLLHRLKECGVRGKMGHWPVVGVEGRLSGLTSVVSGVPQGTVWGLASS